MPLNPLREPEQQGEAPSPPNIEIPALIEQAQQAFSRDLAELLQDHPGQWVAYHGPRRVGFAASKTPLYQDCLRRGLDENEFIVQRIEPEIGTVFLGLPTRG